MYVHNQLPPLTLASHHWQLGQSSVDACHRIYFFSTARDWSSKKSQKWSVRVHSTFRPYYNLFLSVRIYIINVKYLINVNYFTDLCRNFITFKN